LRTLYERCSRARDVRPWKIGEFLERHPPRDSLPHLFAGSWISHNFAIWIGHQEDNRGWDALHATRQFLLAEERTGRPDQASLARAWEEVFIAEGSDWFWWFGDDHSSAQDSLFDHLFRKHLRNVYTLLGCDPPGILFTPISQAGSHRPINDQPMSFLNVKIDGHATYFEWIDGVRYFCGNERGTMAIVTKGLIQCLWFGFDAERFLLRLDIEGGPASERLAEVDRLRVGFIDPVDREVVAVQPSTRQPVAYLNHAGRTLANGSTIAVATGEILEMAVPFARLERMPGDPIRFYVELLKGESSVDRAPRDGIFELTAPCPDFERIMWQV
jgi:hypothetical protein